MGEKKLPNQKVNKTNKVWVPSSSKYDAPKISRTHLNQTKPSPLLLGSCSYIDLTIAQSMCGPGYKAMVEKLGLSLHHNIFFAVHRGDRWQCCRSSKNMTLAVPCAMGARC